MECPHCSCEQSEDSVICSVCGSKMDYYIEPRTEVKDAPRKKITAPSKWKYGWGWMVVGGVLSYNRRQYAALGEYSGLIEVTTVVIALAIYFWLRQKIFINIKSMPQRSLISGVAALLFGGGIFSVLRSLAMQHK